MRVLFLTFLDTTIVAVALGSVQADLQVGVVSLQWVVGAYALVFASLMLPARHHRGSVGSQAVDAYRLGAVLRRPHCSARWRRPWHC